MKKITLPPIPREEALVFGHGGGFMLAYEELAMLPSGRVDLTSFVLADNDEPSDVETARLFMLSTEVYQHFLQELVRIDFRSVKLPEPESDLLEYLSHTQQGPGTHTVVWSRGHGQKLPAALTSIVSELRGVCLAEFKRAFGD